MAPKTTTFVPDPPRVRDRWFNTSTVGGILFAESLTKQEFKDECDINIIMGRYATSPPRPWASPPMLRYGDFADAPDFLGAQLLVKRAEEQFMTLDGKVRERFGNDPARFLAFVHDPKNLAEARALGLLKAEAAPPPPPAAPPAEPPK